MRYLRERCNCNMCPLNGSNKVYSTYGEGAKIAIIAEAPGVAEDESGVPLSGPSGRIFNLGLQRAGLHRDNLWIGNTILCRPPDNSITSPEGYAAVQCCRNGLNEELRRMRSAGIRVIAAMGSTAANALGLEGNILKIRGSVYKHEATGILVIPTVHPAAILHGGNQRKSGGVSMLAAFISDLTKLKEVSIDGWKPPKEKFIIEPTEQDVIDFVDEALTKKQLIALDIETTGLFARRGAKPVVIGLASSTEHALVVPLLKEHGLPYWQNGSALRVRNQLQRLFREGRFILQNCFFDIPFLRVHGYEISIDNVEHDTMVLHSLISPETEHNLGYIVSIYGQTPEWKEAFKHREVGILEMNQTEMRQYNARDCVVLHQVLQPMLRDLDSYNLRKFYEEETRPLMRSFMQMIETGVGFDASRMTAFTKKLTEIVDEKRKEVFNAFELPLSFSLDNIDEVRWFMFGQPPTKASRLRSTLITYEKELKKGKKTTTKLFEGLLPKEIQQKNMPANVLSIEEVDTLVHKKAGTAAYAELEEIHSLMQLKPLYRLSSYKGSRTSGAKEKVSRDALLSYRIALQNRLAQIEKLVKPEAKADEVEDIENVLFFMELYGEYKEKQKLITSFTKYGADPDNRIRPSWLMHGTATGRPSCTKPNLNQLPARGEGKEVRKFFRAPDGFKIIDADFENLEVALLAYETGDQTLIDIFEQNRNIHDENATMLFDMAPINDEKDPLYSVWKSYRDAAKVFQFGYLSYGGGERQILKMMLMKAPKLRLTLAGLLEAKEKWMAVHPAYKTWKENIIEEVTAKRRLVNAFGRQRIFLGHPRDIIKEGMNFMIQSAGASVTNRSMIRLEEGFRQKKMQTKIIMQVYDEIVLEAPDEEVEEASKILVTSMTQPFSMRGRIAQMRTEATVGQTYGDAK